VTIRAYRHPTNTKTTAGGGTFVAEISDAAPIQPAPINDFWQQIPCGIFVVNPGIRQLERVGTERDTCEQARCVFRALFTGIWRVFAG